MIVFLYPFMIVLLLLPFLVRYLLPAVRGIYGDALRVPFIKDFARIEALQKNGVSSPFVSPKSKSAFWGLFALWILLVLAEMRPQQIGEPIRLKNDSRDILMVMDISTSMLETDFSYQGKRLDRLTAVKAVASDFIKKRPADRVGLILFGTRAYLQVPLTFDKSSLDEVLWSMEAGMAGNSTSVGDALGLALKSLRQEEKTADKQNKIIILLTDGESNDGSLSLPQAIDLAEKEGVKVYTIGVGGGSFSLANAFFGIKNSPLDEESLKTLAEKTKGRYFRADDLKGLVGVYQAIDQLEPENREQNFVYPRQELYYWPLLAAFVLASMMAYAYRRRRA